MRAAVLQGNDAMSVEELPVPVAGPDQALVEVRHCGICGSDLHFVFDGFGRPGAVLGHEWSGVVLDPGPRDDLAPGDRVVGDTLPGCGRCRPCRLGRPSVCTERPQQYDLGVGAFAEVLAVDAARLLRIPDGLSTRAAALTEPVAIAQHAVTLSGALDGPPPRVLVTGAGPVGALITAVLAAHGVRDMPVSEPSAVRRARALELGALRVVTPDELPEPPMATVVADPVDIAFECSGRSDAAERAFAQLAPAGTLVFVGTGMAPPRINHNRAIIFELSVVGAYNYDPGGFGPALELLASGRLPIDLLVEPEDVGLDEVLPTMRRLVAGELAGKVLVDPTREVRP